MQREKVAIIYMRKRFKYSISVLSKFFGRSKSLIQALIDFNVRLGTIPRLDNRTFHPHIRRLAKARMERQMNSYLKLWMAFLLGLEEKPP